MENLERAAPLAGVSPWRVIVVDGPSLFARRFAGFASKGISNSRGSIRATNVSRRGTEPPGRDPYRVILGGGSS